MWTKKKESEKFYSDFPKKLISDYIKGNPRTIAAINFFLSQINSNVKNILDVGCGIGWSSYEMASKSSANVYGIDLSENSIKAGKEIFKFKKLLIEKKDFLSENYNENQYDVITFLDVFEHIPKESRNDVYKKLNKILTNKSMVLLTCPSIYHQENLRKNNPEGLQPVDENIDLKVLIDFAKQINGEIVFFSYKNIWHKNDYFHCAIERGANFNDKLTNNFKQTVDNSTTRLKLIKRSILKKDFIKEIQRVKQKKILKKILRWTRTFLITATLLKLNTTDCQFTTVLPYSRERSKQLYPV